MLPYESADRIVKAGMRDRALAEGALFTVCAQSMMPFDRR